MTCGDTQVTGTGHSKILRIASVLAYEGKLVQGMKRKARNDSIRGPACCTSRSRFFRPRVVDRCRMGIGHCGVVTVGYVGARVKAIFGY